jgi:hypothetical protein
MMAGVKAQNLIAFSLIVLTYHSAAFASHTLDAEQKSVLAAWLGSHPGYRLAEDRDCQCDKDIQNVRTKGLEAFKADPDYHPYQVSGDFNGDGVTDLAVFVVNERKEHDFKLLVFNGPLDPKRPVAAYSVTFAGLTGAGLFYWGVTPTFEPEGDGGQGLGPSVSAGNESERWQCQTNSNPEPLLAPVPRRW